MPVTHSIEEAPCDSKKKERKNREHFENGVDLVFGSQFGNQAF